MPEDTWPTTLLGDLYDLVSARSDPSTLPANTRYLGLEHVGSNDLTPMEGGVAAGVTSSVTPFRSGDVLFGRLRPYLRKVAIADSDGVCTPEILVLRPRAEAVAPGFLPILVASEPVIEQCIARSAGSRMPRTSPADLASIEVPLPPMADQARIVNLVGSASEAGRAASGVADATSRAHLSVLVNLMNNFQETSRVARLDGLMAHVIGGAWGSDPGTEAQDVLALSPAVFANGSVTVDPSRSALRSLSAKRAMVRSLAPGDIVLERSGGSDDQPVGRVVVCADEFTTPVVPSDFMRLLRVDSELAHPGYVYWVLWVKYLLGNTRFFSAKTTGIWNLRIPDYLTSEIPVPRTSDQQQFASLAWEFAEATSAAVAYADALAHSRAALVAHLLGGTHRMSTNHSIGMVSA